MWKADIEGKGVRVRWGWKRDRGWVLIWLGSREQLSREHMFGEHLSWNRPAVAQTYHQTKSRQLNRATSPTTHVASNQTPFPFYRQNPGYAITPTSKKPYRLDSEPQRNMIGWTPDHKRSWLGELLASKNWIGWTPSVRKCHWAKPGYQRHLIIWRCWSSHPIPQCWTLRNQFRPRNQFREFGNSMR
jgi:hypothetical protein